MKIFAFADEADKMIDGQIDALKRNGLSGLEIRSVDGVNVSDITLEKAKEVREKLDANGLITWSVGSPIGKIRFERDDFSQHLEKFKHTLEIANILGAENMRIFSFYPPKEKSIEPYRDEVIDRLSRFVELAKGSGVDLCHENEKGIYGDIASRCLDIHTQLPSLKAVFDPANFVQCGQDTLEAWQMLKPYVKYMHIKDALCDGSVVPAGCGDGHVKEIALQFTGNFTMEPHLKVFDGLAELEAEDEKSLVGKFVYKTNDEAFDAACNAFKELML